MVLPTPMALITRISLLFLLLAVAHVSRASAGLVGTSGFGVTRFASGDSGASDGLVGDMVDEYEEMGMESESSRRVLAAARRRFISYGALEKNKVPCNRRGHSYYNCAKRGRANPYRRGCSKITRCARDLH